MSKITDWWVLYGNESILRPSFLVIILMDGHSYWDMLNKEILSTLATLLFLDQRNHGYLRRFWWIQDVVPGHCFGKVNHGLKKVFWNRVAAVNHKNKWPSKSPSLTPHNFLWGHIKIQRHHCRNLRSFMIELSYNALGYQPLFKNPPPPPHLFLF